MTMGTFDPYAVLGVPAGASREELARAHRRLAKRYHPDINPGPAAAERMRRINEAWRILSNPARRANHEAVRSTVPRPAAHWAAGQPRTATWVRWDRAAPRAGRPIRSHQPEPSFGDRPLVIVAVWVFLALFYFIGAFLGSLTP
jgi:curved DNA-binding protein